MRIPHADLVSEDSTPFDAPLAPAARRCLSACAAEDHRHAEALNRRGHSKPKNHYPARHQRIEIAGRRAEVASRDLVLESRT
ncbi:hypothetical protein NB688_000561 [Xanthomonas sacchari]|uniref:Transposase n=1 Tax=Xanthomonas sacchari TaxID=56458 RepID=A0ABT3DTD7_9XANT|nr:hypothetical protein [Xanthomonas sacchari]MCW0398747.1 hypothetical protein [Xanthomonas sacchari]MCW0418395.1 hypothetical protein [Xanthomonas sacchari]UYK72543.1 hypothetical protein NG828_20540 [Xanthomonas sacchari]